MKAIEDLPVLSAADVSTVLRRIKPESFSERVDRARKEFELHPRLSAKAMATSQGIPYLTFKQALSVAKKELFAELDKPKQEFMKEIVTNIPWTSPSEIVEIFRNKFPTARESNKRIMALWEISRNSKSRKHIDTVYFLHFVEYTVGGKKHTDSLNDSNSTVTLSHMVQRAVFLRCVLVHTIHDESFVF